MSENTALDFRMKRYEHAYRDYLPRRTYTLMRLDGRAFHTYLRGAEKPFDAPFIADMNLTAQRLCEEIMGARFAYVQSDEISILLTDFDAIQSEQWVGGNVSKLLSLSAGLASAFFTRIRGERPGLPHFDCRLWTMSDPVEVANYFIWRQRDAVRNSIQMVAQTYYRQSELTGKSTNELQDILFREQGINWNDLPADRKRGRLVAQVPMEGWLVRAAPHFKAEPGTELAEMIPRLPTLT